MTHLVWPWPALTTLMTDRTVMYEQHFGLRKKLFRAVAVGPNVFVGPQTATAMASLKKALKSDGAIVTVSGPAGSGKTTLVGKALMAIGDSKTTILIGRIRLSIEDVLDLLLKELEVKPVPKGTLQKFAALRETLRELESRNSRLIVVVEDAARMGAETLAELEALTATDAGPSEGANIVLMADEQLDDLLHMPQLARLTQRIRQRLTVEPLCASELRGYLRHCFRLAGGDFEQIFSDDAAELLHRLSGGIARTANSIVESALKAATEENQQQVTSSLVSKVAADEFGLSSAGFTAVTRLATGADSASLSEIEGTAELTPDPEREVTFESKPEPLLESTREPPVETADEPVIVFSDAPDDEIPEFINDTLPDLEVLAPEFANAASQGQDLSELLITNESVTDEIAGIAPERVIGNQTPKDIPELDVADAVAKDVPELPVANIASDDVPELVVTDVVSEVVPKLAAADVDALDVPELDVSDAVNRDEPKMVVAAEVPELAIADAAANDIAELTPDPVAPPEPEFELKLEKTRVDLPAATVPDSERDPTLAELKPDLAALEEAMAFTRTGALAEDSVPAPASSEQTEERPKTAEVSDLIPEITLDKAINERIESEHANESGDAGVDNSEVDSIVQDLAKAKSIEDIDDRMAETLFGEEFSLIASQVVARAAEFESANDEPADEVPLNQELENVDVKVETEMPRVSATGNAAAVDLTLEAPLAAPSSAVDLGATQQRLNMVRELNSAPRPSRPMPDLQAANESAPLSHAEPAPVEPPEPIENQINTSITQTLKALSLKDLPDNDDGDEEEERKGGFFSRFKRS